MSAAGDVVAGHLVSGIPTGRLCTVTLAHDNHVFGVVTQTEAVAEAEDLELYSPGFLVKGWILQLVEGRHGTLHWADFIPSCPKCKGMLCPILHPNQVAMAKCPA
ncbi:unnamed protein product, partial [Symbiodinium microadriaticum]